MEEIKEKFEEQKPEEKKRGGCCVSIVLILVVAVIVFLFTRNKGNPEINKLRKELYQKYDISAPSSVLHDKTGKWRLSLYTSSVNPDQFIINYYKSFFNSDDEVHWIINFGTNTTTCVRYSQGLLSFEIHERVPNEELDASTLGSGILYGSYRAYLDTGVVEKIG